MKTLRTFTVLSFLLLIYNISIAQISVKGSPPSFVNEEVSAQNLESIQLPNVNLRKVRREDEANPGSTRFTTPIPVNYSLENAGQWVTLENGDQIWRLKLKSNKALGLMVLYKDFYLPPGAKLFMYNEDRSIVLGAYTSRNNKESRHFMTGLIPGEMAILEYYEPQAVLGQGQFTIFRVDHAYDRDNYENALANASPAGFGDSDPCNINVNCPEGDAYANQKRSVCRIYLVVEEGIGFCTGTLMNNTSSDQTPYVLSAFHCQDGFTPLYHMWRFDFDYAANDCQNPFLEPGFASVVGSTLRSGWQASDFLLLELSTIIPNSFEVYYNGWNRDGIPPDTSAIIHHPIGDIMKVSLMEESAIVFPGSIDWNNDVTTPPNHHFWVPCTTGFFELGSSGCGYFNPSGQLIGQLHGHAVSPECNDSKAYFGRLSISWEGGGSSVTRLRDWLDPEDTGATELEGTDEGMSGTSSLSGQVFREDGETIGNVDVTMSTETSELTFSTGMDGFFDMPGLQQGEVYDLSLAKDMDHLNGVSTFDMVLIAKHILGVDPLGSPYRIIAADVNGSGSVSTFDLVLIRRLILTIDPEFTDVPSWVFVPADLEFTNPQDPFLTPIPSTFQINVVEELIMQNFIGIKKGDVNNSAQTN